MQFHLERDELQFLANLLLAQDLDRYGEIFDKIMSGDMRFDASELEDTAELLSATKHNLKDAIAHHPNPAQIINLERQLTLLERVLEHVNEACVMF